MKTVLLLSSITCFVGCSNDTTKGVSDTQNVDTAAPIQDDETEDSGEIADTSVSEDTSVPEDSAEEEPQEPSYSCDDNSVYTPVPIGNWMICRSKQLEQNQPAQSTAAFQLLESDLAFIEGLLEPSIIEYLQSVYIWLEEDIPAFPGGVYHPSATWLSNNGYPAYWAQGVQIGNASNYLNWTQIQPAMILHELSHAWHHQVLSYNQAEIIEAYNAAMSSGIYNEVEYAGGGIQQAYATTNQQEYFAELTEAYFWENDFYPFNRNELMTFDPQGYQVVVDAWQPLE